MNTFDYKPLPRETLLKIAREAETELDKQRTLYRNAEFRLHHILREIAETFGIKEGQYYSITTAFINAQPTDGLRKHWQDYFGAVYKVTDFRLVKTGAEAEMFSAHRNNSFAWVALEWVVLMERLDGENK